MKQVSDFRLSSNPKVYSNDDHLRLKMRELRPDILEFINELFLTPAGKVWRFWSVVLLINLISSHFIQFDLFSFSDLNPIATYITLLTSGILYYVDRFTRYAFWRFLFGSHIEVAITSDELWLKKGWGIGVDYTSFNKSATLAFLRKEIPQIGSAYSQAVQIALEHDGMYHEVILEVHDPLRARDILQNLNVAFLLSQRAQQYGASHNDHIQLNPEQL